MKESFLVASVLSVKEEKKVNNQRDYKGDPDKMSEKQKKTEKEMEADPSTEQKTEWMSKV